ncbi:hypothetical protein L7F22_033274 [Adiantum nelumboides]|nr:hypothetical protein [Adiantum nelumboides]
MGVKTRSLSPGTEKSHSCIAEVPLGILMSSLHSAKEFIFPVSSYIGRTFAEHTSNTMSSIVLASVSFTQDRSVCQDSLDNGRQGLSKETSSCDSLPHNGSQNKVFEGHHFALTSVRLRSGFLQLCTDDDTSETKKSLNGFPEQHFSQHQNRFSGLTLQGLIPSFCLILKNDSGSDKSNSSVCLDECASQKPFTGMSLFQSMMEHCLFAGSIISKQAGQVVPVNDNFLCAINDSKEKVMGFLHENLCISVTIQSNQQVSSFWQKRGNDKKVELSSCVKPALLGFARVGGDIKAIVPSITNTDGSALNQSGTTTPEPEDTSSTSTAGIFKVPMPTIERLRSSLSTVSLTELIELVPQLGKTSQDFPDKKKLFSVQDFFRYTEAEGRRFFEELDRDNDGQVTLEDLESVMRKRRLPQQYAREFLRRTRKNWFAKSFGWIEFLSLMEQKEPMMLRAYNSLSLSKSGTLQKSQVLTSLRSAGLPATEENVAAMMRCLDPDTKGSIAYGQFRNFMLLLPPERLGDDPR